MSTNDSDSQTVAATFQFREDAERAVIELREEGFTADTIDSVFSDPPGPIETLDDRQKPDHPIVTEAGAPGTTASKAAEAVLPDAPTTTMTGASPFGEASSYIPGLQDEKPGQSSVTVRTTRDQAAEAKSILLRNNGVIPT